MSDTPRTDSQNKCFCDRDADAPVMVSAEFARQLERELAEVREQYKQMVDLAKDIAHG